MKITRQTLVLITLLLSPLAFADNHALSISDAWIREAPPTQRVLACYMQIQNESNTPRKITAVKSPAFGSVEIHKTIFKDGMARMEAQPELLVPAMGKIVLEPGGLHLMLIDPENPLHTGDRVELELQIESGETQKITAEVRPGGGAETDHSHHHH